MKRVLVLMITSALLAGMVGCTAGLEPTPPIEYSLTISSSDGGEVTTPGEGSFTYEEGTAVNLVAVAEEGYQFVDWTGDVDTGEHVSAASVTIIMNRDRSVAANFAKTDSDPVTIWDWYDLDSIRDNLTGSYLLMNDLDSTTVGYMQVASATANNGRGWEPIGSPRHSFVGSFDGQGYEIRSLFVARPGEDCVGLFGYVYAGAFIMNIGLPDAIVVGRSSVGGLAGLNADGGTIASSWSTGSVTGVDAVGGLVGHNNGSVYRSYSSCNVVGHSDVGGLTGVGWVFARVVSSYSTGSVTGEQYVGGLIGTSRCYVNSSYSTSDVTGRTCVGGILGRNGGHLIGSYCAGRISGYQHVGGLVGYYDLASPDYSKRAVATSFWDRLTSGMEGSDGGTAKSTSEMQRIATFIGAGWSIVGVADSRQRDVNYTWNIVDGQTYPFLSWQPVS